MMSGSGRPESAAKRLGGKAPGHEQLPAAIWVALNIGRDNKALVVSTDGVIVNINQLASRLCGRAAEDLVGKCVISEFFERPRSSDRSGATQRWETELKSVSGARIPVEV